MKRKQCLKPRWRWERSKERRPLLRCSLNMWFIQIRCLSGKNIFEIFYQSFFITGERGIGDRIANCRKQKAKKISPAWVMEKMRLGERNNEEITVAQWWGLLGRSRSSYYTSY
jgi:hypothetical protein